MKIIKTSFIGNEKTVSDYCQELIELTKGKFSYQINPNEFFIKDENNQSYIIIGEVTEKAFEDMYFTSDWISVNGNRIDISIEDVLDVAEQLKMTISAQQVNYVMKYYAEDKYNNPTDLWSEVIENLLYQSQLIEDNI